MQRNILMSIGLASVMCLVGFLNPLMAEVIEEFDAPVLNPELWELKEVGNASHTIEDGVLTLSSPGVEDGSNLYYIENIAGMDINFEMTLDTSTVGDYTIMISTTQFVEPGNNLDIGFQWLAGYYVQSSKITFKEDPANVGAFPPNAGEQAYVPGENIFEIQFKASEDTIVYLLDGEELHTVDYSDHAERYFYITPDPYTTHYTGEVMIESIRIHGSNSPILAVDSRGKLATTWGEMKSR